MQLRNGILFIRCLKFQIVLLPIFIRANFRIRIIVQPRSITLLVISILFDIRIDCRAPDLNRKFLPRLAFGEMFVCFGVRVVLSL